MLRDITIGQHFPGNSILHTMDPRVKLLLTIAYIVMLFVGSNPAVEALTSCASGTPPDLMVPTTGIELVTY